jgi:transcriptional regulator with XRE-family HTH domain
VIDNIRKTQWDDAGFVHRCAEAARRRGWSLEEELAEQAGFDRYYFGKPASVGRRIDIVMKLADTLGVSLDWLAGVFPAPEPLDSTELARLVTVANVATHLYFAIKTHPPNLLYDDIIRAVLSTIQNPQSRPDQPAVEE